MNLEYCEHLRPIDQCVACSVAELIDQLGALAAAATAGRTSAVRGQSVGGGQPSWEPIDIRPMSLLQDIARDGAFLERRMRSLLEDPYQPVSIDAADILWRVRNLIERTDPTQPIAKQARSRILSWRNSARVILGVKLPPYDLVAETVVETDTAEGERVRQVVGVRVKCPVIGHWHGNAGACGAQLLVHRNSDDRSSAFGDVERVTCTRDDSHTWGEKREWLRLRLLISDALKAAS